MIRDRENVISAWAFLSGIFITLIIGVFAREGVSPTVMGILALLGLIIGFSVSESDAQKFLLASVSLVIVVSMSSEAVAFTAAHTSGIPIGKMVSSILQSLLALFVPATIVVIIKTLFSISRK